MFKCLIWNIFHPDFITIITKPLVLRRDIKDEEERLNRLHRRIGLNWSDRACPINISRFEICQNCEKKV